MDRFEVHLHFFDHTLVVADQCLKCEMARATFHAVMMAVMTRAYDDMRLQSLLIAVIPPDLNPKQKRRR